MLLVPGGQALGTSPLRLDQRRGRTLQSTVFAACDADSKPLHQARKLHCVTAEASVMDYVVRAIEERFARSTDTPAPRRSRSRTPPRTPLRAPRGEQVPTMLRRR